MPSLAVVMVVADEQQFIEACLALARPISDQIIILDLGVKKMKSLIAPFICQKDIYLESSNDMIYDRGFGFVRNAITSFASSDWVFHLDADEYIVSEKDEVVALISASTKNFISVNRINIDPNGVNTTTERHTRIYRNRAGFFKGFIHEELYAGEQLAVHASLLSDVQLDHYSAFRTSDPNLKQQKYDWMLLKAVIFPELRAGINDWFFSVYAPSRMEHIVENAAIFARREGLQDLTPLAAALKKTT